MDGEVISRFTELRSFLGQGFRHVPHVAGRVFLHHLGGAHVLPELRLVGQCFRFRPGDFERLRTADRVPFARCDDTEEITLAHAPGNARNFLDRGLVYLFDLGADGRRPHHAPVQHAGHAEVLHVGEATGDLVGNVEPRRRLADNLVVLRRFFLYRLLWIELDREALVTDQFGVADLLATTGHDDAVSNGEV